ncbi:hypothetical protein FAZ19_09905 [Sphingobacterium alkalisoli]|uniref:Fibronectin type-III domain-containing protein n=1 Tax=Sphingobacterium alkalisoli TaxID=1874115 RepID=A0A4U0H1L6_9SPHI|nr:hypothetical protein [Sphingobacterium alkalisoli]TJY65450.1 hypothetical protein FAZ19_09905 [Sphingobacterium alkalisoli]GGH20392.1 hypothetical protein GCM10011418_25550 [Sphingobacterium alkalisoli]
MFSYLKPISLLVLLTLLLACEKGSEFSYEHENVQAVTSHQPTDFDRNTAILLGQVNTVNKSKLSEVGFEYGISDRPESLTMYVNRHDKSDTGMFSIEIAELTPSTQYYYRAYAKNAHGTAYGKTLFFSTLQGTAASLTTGEATEITRSSASISGLVTDHGGYKVTRKGICYSNTTSTPTINNTVVDFQGEGTSFHIMLADLQAGKRYYARAYAVTSMGTAYGNSVSFTTSPAILATGLSTTYPTNITASSMIISGQILQDNNSAITARGFCYSRTTNVPTITNATISQAGSGKGSFSSTLTNLTASTMYYIRSFATNSAGTAYGNLVSVRTGLPNLPSSILVTNVFSVTTNSAVCHSTIGNAGGGTISARGICFSRTTTQPTITNGTVITSGTGTGSYSTSINSLDPATTYYVRAYATNEAGTSYSNAYTFSTAKPNLPSGISAYAANSITLTSASISGFVSNAGGGIIKQRGIVVSSTTSTPTVGNGVVFSSGGGTGSFQVAVGGLNASTSYYYRAYATNEAGTSYSSTQRFTTSSASAPGGVVTSSARALSSTTALLKGSIGTDGGATITSRGFVYSSATTNPTLNYGTRVQVGNGTGSFEVNISSLKRNTTYYVRSYATNSRGTSYSTVLALRTP